MTISSFFTRPAVKRTQCISKIFCILNWFCIIHDGVNLGVQIRRGRLFSKISNVKGHSLSNVPLQTFHLWIWTIHSATSFELRNVKVSYAPFTSIVSSSSIAKIQEFRRHSVRISFCHGRRGGAWWRIGMLHESSSFLTRLNGDDLWEKGRVKEMLTLGSNGLLNVFIWNSLNSSNLTFPKLCLQGIEKLCNVMLLNIWSKLKHGPLSHLWLSISQVYITVW